MNRLPFAEHRKKKLRLPLRPPLRRPLREPVVVHVRFGPVRLGLLLLLLLPCAVPATKAAADAGDSVPLWTFVAPGEIVGSPAYGRTGLLLFAAEDRRLYALDGDGLLQWRHDLRRMPHTGPAIGRDGMVYLGLSPNRIRAVEPSGRHRWTIAGASPPLAVVPVPAGPVLGVFRDGEIVAVTPRGGRLWQRTVHYRFAAAPVVTRNGLLITGGETGEVAATDLLGRGVWSLRLDAAVSALAATAENGVLVGDARGTVTAVNARGNVVWSRPVFETAIRSMVLDGAGALYVRSEAGELVRVSASGEVGWYFALEGALEIPHVVAVAVGAGGLVVGATNDGAIVALNAAGGTVWHAWGPGRTPYKQLIVTPEGRLLLGTQDWVVELHGAPIELPAASRGVSSAWQNARGGAAADGVAAGFRGAAAALYRDNLDYIYLDELARSDRVADRQRVLTDIEQRIRSGRMASDYLYIVEILFALATRRRVIPGGVQEEAWLDDRIRAFAALGQVADGTAQRRLAGLLAEERSPVVRVAVVRAMGGIGLDPDGDAARAIRSVVRRPDATRAEQMASVDALSALGSSNWHPVRGHAVETLAWLAAETRVPGDVRQAAGQRLLRLE